MRMNYSLLLKHILSKSCNNVRANKIKHGDEKSKFPRILFPRTLAHTYNSIPIHMHIRTDNRTRNMLYGMVEDEEEECEARRKNTQMSSRNKIEKSELAECARA